LKQDSANQDCGRTFLVIEDDANDAFLIRRAFTEEQGHDMFVFVCRNTSEARAYLLGAGMYSDRQKFPFPQVIVSDVRIGEDSGVHFLQWLRGIDNLQEIPVIMLTGSASQREMDTAKNLGALKVLRKPGDVTKLKQMLLKVINELCPSPKNSHEEREGGRGGRPTSSAARRAHPQLSNENRTPNLNPAPNSIPSIH
jgi:CheY-like chemotaxis protein